MLLSDPVCLERSISNYPSPYTYHLACSISDMSSFFNVAVVLPDPFSPNSVNIGLTSFSQNYLHNKKDFQRSPFYQLFLIIVLNSSLIVTLNSSK